MPDYRNILVPLLFVFIIAGCTSLEKQKIEVQKMAEDGAYEDFKEITHSKEVKAVKQILHHADWEKRKVDMARLPDYEFIFQFVNSNTNAKAITYAVWIAPNKNTLEVVQGEQQYVHLNEKDSSTLFEALTDSKLADVK
ncbi:hypothetical protein FCT18_06375 [Lysinibacillus sphaericus]|uniref:Lipoprotein n=2 Tax=Lysinibacillus TaxID=400634 RepID=A0A2S0K1W2_LYSSH|nr:MULTISPECIES: hypothetical protein [Lysinibacillus]AVK97363.1 hypothetical protein LS41612_14370 [Lysinibacillus sphaericus]MCS1382295.1 hypothetical protein [Lysinibacillus sphaericus]MED4542672.1 hypothetical protein [Lysinibacillus sphaericus]TKI19950.1 hypothetical protein FCT18_06375 [Lysinibacillus sphaericus]TKI47739.1 hypothetical protein FC748_08800 [Lysinibacillus tabacifolii]